MPGYWVYVAYYVIKVHHPPVAEARKQPEHAQAERCALTYATRIVQHIPARCVRGAYPVPHRRSKVPPRLFALKKARFLQPPSNKADHAPAEHLPWRPRPLPKYKIGNERRECARHKARLRPERNGRDYNNCGHGLEIGQRYKLKHRPPHNAKRRHNRQRHHFPRSRLPALKFKKERHAARSKEHQPHYYVRIHYYRIPKAQLPVRAYRRPCGMIIRKRDKQHAQHRYRNAHHSTGALHCSSFLHCEATSPLVMQPGATSPAMRLASVV